MRNWLEAHKSTQPDSVDYHLYIGAQLVEAAVLTAPGSSYINLLKEYGYKTRGRWYDLAGIDAHYITIERYF